MRMHVTEKWDKNKSIYDFLPCFSRSEILRDLRKGSEHQGTEDVNSLDSDLSLDDYKVFN